MISYLSLLISSDQPNTVIAVLKNVFYLNND